MDNPLFRIHAGTSSGTTKKLSTMEQYEYIIHYLTIVIVFPPMKISMILLLENVLPYSIFVHICTVGCA